MTSLVRLTPVTARVRAASFGYTALRTTSLSLPSRATAKTRYISTTTEKDGGVIDSTKGTLKKADRVVSDAAVKGIDKGEKARDTLKNTVGITNKETKAKAENVKDEAAEYAGQGKGKAKEAIEYTKGKSQSAMGEK